MTIAEALERLKACNTPPRTNHADHDPILYHGTITTPDTLITVIFKNQLLRDIASTILVRYSPSRGHLSEGWVETSLESMVLAREQVAGPSPEQKLREVMTELRRYHDGPGGWTMKVMADDIEKYLEKK